MSRTILHLDSSIKGKASDSRRLGSQLKNLWTKQFPTDQWQARDLAGEPLAHVDGLLLDSLMTQPENHTKEMSEALKRADELLDEFLGADVIVIGAPMYNFSIPSTLKAWIDTISRAGRTFKYTENGPVGLVTDTSLVIVSTRGSVFEESPMDHQVAYLKTLFGFLGVTDIQVIQAEGLNLSAESRERSLSAAEAQICSVVAGFQVAA